MGLLRFLLAVSVAFNHYSGENVWFVDGAIAVESFYMVSGFLMAYILTSSYKTVSYRFFLENRFLRIYPTYWIVLLSYLSVLFAVGHGSFHIVNSYGFWLGFTGIYSLSYVSWIHVVVSNCLLFGLDINYFLRLGDMGEFLWTYDFHLYSPWIAVAFVVVPQAWSLAVELWFYLIVPFIMRKKKRVLFLFGVSILIRVYCFYGLGLDFDPWDNRFFFPNEMIFFSMGMVAYYLCTRHKDYIKCLPISDGCIVSAIVFYTLFFPKIYPVIHVRTWAWAYYCFLFAGLPICFVRLSRHPWDSRLGELSYPIYLLHMLVIVLIKQYAPTISLYWGSGVVIGITIVLALVVVYCFERPINRYRHYRLRVYQYRDETK